MAKERYRRTHGRADEEENMAVIVFLGEVEEETAETRSDL